MPLALATSPAVVSSSTTASTTASFTPAANSLLVALVAVGNPSGTATATTGAVTDSLGSTWTLKRRQNNTNGVGAAEVWMMDAGASPAARTVTLTGSKKGTLLAVLIFTGALATASQTGATAVSAATTANTIAITPTATGSYIVGSASDSIVAYAMTAAASSTLVGTLNDATNGGTYGAWRSTSTTAATSAQTFGLTPAPTNETEKVAVEVLAAAAPGAAGLSGAGSLLATITKSTGTPPPKVVAGYLEDWASTGNTPPLAKTGPAILPRDVNSNYNALVMAFATVAADGTASFAPAQNVANLKTDIAAWKAQGKAFILSVGGAGGNKADLSTTAQQNTFLASIKTIINAYGFQGIDWDLEVGGTAPTPSVPGMTTITQNLIATYGSGFMITMAPYDATEAFYQQLAAAILPNLTWVGYQFYNLDANPTAASIQAKIAAWLTAVPGMSASQFMIGLMTTTDDYLGLRFPYDQLQPVFTAVQSAYPLIRGSFIWGINEDWSENWQYATTIAPAVYSTTGGTYLTASAGMTGAGSLTATTTATQSGGSAPSPALVQQVTGTTTTSVSSYSTSGLAATAKGNLAVLVITPGGSTDTSGVTSVTDNGGNTWQRGGYGFSTGTSNTRVEAWWAQIAASFTAVTVTAGASSIHGWNFTEWSGMGTVSVDAVSPDASNTGTTTTAPVTPTITTSTGPDLVIAAQHLSGTLGTDTLNAAGSTPTTGWTALSSFDGSTSSPGRAAYALPSAAGSFAAAWTLSTAKLVGTLVIAFKGTGVARAPVSVKAIGSVVTTTGTSLTVSPPAGTAAGDYLVAVLYSQSSGSSVDWTFGSTGFARLGPAFIPTDSATRAGGLYGQMLSAAAPASYTFTTPTGSGTRSVGAIIVLSNVDPTTPVDSSGPWAGLVSSSASLSVPAGGTTGGDYTLEVFEADYTAGNSYALASYDGGLTDILDLANPAGVEDTAVSRTMARVFGGTAPAGGVPAHTITTVGPSSHRAAYLVSFRTAGTPVPAYTVSAAFTGTGGLNASPSGPAYTASASLSGVGALSATTTKSGPPTPAVLTGSGALSAATLTIPRGYASVAEMLAQGTFYAAHRGGSLDYPEMSLYAYQQAALRGYPALEVSLSRTSDGVWFGCHDASLDRTSLGTGGGSGTTLVASSMTWAQVQQYQILGSTATNNPGQASRPYMRWEELIANFYPSHMLFVDPKNALSFRSELMAMMNALPGRPQDHFIGKYYGVSGNSPESTGWNLLCHQNGYTTWGYFYDADLADYAAYAPRWDILGEDYTAPQTSWNALKAAAPGKRIMGHIVPTQAAATTALGLGATGLMVSGVNAVTPASIARLSSAGFSGAGALAAATVPGRKVAASLTGSGALAASAALAALGRSPLYRVVNGSWVASSVTRL